MEALQEKEITCPYCWESITILVDASVSQQDYVEDCFVCCRPILFSIHVDNEGFVTASAQAESD